MSTEPCIQPNADIAGIGVRVAIYVQALLCAIILFIALRDLVVTQEENKALQKTISSLLLTGCALLISSFIQAATMGLSAYHAIIVLNLCWINCWTLFISWWGFILVQPPPSDPLPAPGPQQAATRSELYVTQFVVVTSVHLSLMAALGLWVWARIETFGDNPVCNKLPFFVIFDLNIPITNPGLRIFFLIGYSLIAIPGANILLLIVLRHNTTGLLDKIADSMSKKWLAPRWTKANDYFPYFSRIVIPAFFYVTFVVNNELMIRRNEGFILNSQELDWTLGQTLSLVLLIIPLVDIWERIWE